MGWIISLALLIGGLIVDDRSFVMAAALFAIAGSIGAVATNLKK